MVRLSAAAVLISGCVASDVTPLQKVLDMMNDMLKKGKEEKHKEEVAFNEFKVWCDQTRTETQKSIKDGADAIVQLSADIEKAIADAENLKEEIAALEDDRTVAEEELKKATKIRAKENSDYKEEHADLSESVDALDRAITTLKNKDVTVAQSLIQLQSNSRIPARTKATIQAFLSLNEESGAPEAAAYEFQSGGLIDMMEKLKIKFEDQRTALEKAEIAAKGNYDTLAQALTDNIKDMSNSINQKTQKKATRKSDAAEAKGDLEITKSAKAEDETKLSDTLAECSARADEFEKNQVLRSEEIKAITKAAEILASPEVSGNADKHLPSMVQTSFAQLRSASPDTRARVVEFLRSKAQKTGSQFLALIASHAAEDPFAKVKSMIKDLIVKLMEEANAEADHKGFCDAELATNKQTREIKSSEVESLSSDIDKNEADISQLSEEITVLSDDIASINSQQQEAARIRNEEHEKNMVTINDAKVAQNAVEKAMKVLKEFYDKAAEAAFVQSTNGLDQEMAAATKEPYKGMAAGGGNVVDFLDVILSDFARLEAETSTEESEQASAHEKFMNESSEDKAVKEAEMKHKQGKRDNLQRLNHNLGKELEMTQGELDAAMAYYDKLKPDCVDQGLSYEDRVQQRKEEIESLKEALQILSS
jgi:predicted  nucleic acid-binding Zn-ribbon protein